MTIVFFSDIDDTLIQSKKKCLNEPNLTPVSVDVTGKSSSFSTPAQQALISLCSDHVFIPVTGRNKAAFDRVNIDSPAYQVIDHGAIVLNEKGVIDAQWADMLVSQPLDWAEILTDYVEQVTLFITQQQLSLRVKLISDFGFACYISIKGSAQDLAALSNICESFEALADNARVHLNGTNMALLPPFACKRLAVQYIKALYLQRNSNTLFVGLGDSESDLAFMQECHFQMIPQNSQISKQRLQ